METSEVRDPAWNGPAMMSDAASGPAAIDGVRMECMLVTVLALLVAILACNAVDEVAYWWALRRTDPRRHVGLGSDTTVALRDA